MPLSSSPCNASPGGTGLGFNAEGECWSADPLKAKANSMAPNERAAFVLAFWVRRRD